MGAVAVRHAIVIEPDAPNGAVLADWKRRMAAIWPAAVYVSHPPHATLWAGELASPDAAATAVESAAASIGAFPVRLDRAMVFEPDALAAGGATCAIRIAAEPALSRLQETVAEALVPYLAPVDAVALPLALRRAPFLPSWLTYGFPFVGAHWIPHLTIGAVPAGSARDFIDSFLEAGATGTFAVDRLTIWRVEGERHSLVRHCRLHGA